MENGAFDSCKNLEVVNCHPKFFKYFGNKAGIIKNNYS